MVLFTIVKIISISSIYFIVQSYGITLIFFKIEL